VPTYNRAGFIGATLESVLAQTLPATEVIIIDDGSTDNTRDICAHYAAPVRYIRQENQGLSAARNAGFRAAAGDWIAFCDSDDLWEPHKLELQMKAIAATNTAWCFADFRVIDPDGKPVRPGISGLAQTFPVLKDRGVDPASHFSKWIESRQIAWGASNVTIYHGDLFGMLFLGNIVLPSTAIVSRALMERAGPFDETTRRAEETEFFHRISHEATACIVMNEVACYRVGHTSLMKDANAAPIIEYALRSLHAASARRPQLTKAERAAFHEGCRQLRLRLAYTRLSLLDGAGARRAVYEAWREDRFVSPRSAAIMAASFLPNVALRGLTRVKQAISRRLG
jgi:hypothetical protein